MNVLNILNILNQPIFLLILSLLWGSFVTAFVVNKLQNKNKINELKISHCYNIYLKYYAYIRTIKNVTCIEEFSKVHSEILSLSRVSGIIFDDKTIEDDWVNIAQRFSNIYNKSLKGEKCNSKKELEVVFLLSNKVKEKMSLEVNT